jgi:hypothetical protein
MQGLFGIRLPYFSGIGNYCPTLLSARQPDGVTQRSGNFSDIKHFPEKKAQAVQSLPVLNEKFYPV